MKKTIAPAVLAISLFLPAAPASAQSTWTNLVDIFWTTPGNWAGGVAPVSSPTLQLVFPALTGFSPRADANFTVNQILIDSPPAYAIDGNPLTMDGTNPAISVLGPFNSIANTVFFNAATSIQLGYDFTLSGGTGGPAPLTLAGAGNTLTLSGSSIHLGLTTISTGTLLLGGAGAGPTVLFDVANDGTLEFATGAAISVNGFVTGSGAVRVTSGTVSSATPAVHFTHAGTTTIGPLSTLGGRIDNTAQLSLDGTMNLAGDTVVGSLVGTGVLNLGTHSFTAGGDNSDATFAVGQILGTGTFNKVGTGRQSLAQLVTYTGDTVIAGGTLRFGDGAFGPFGVFDVSNDAALEVDLTGTFDFMGTVTGTGTVRLLDGVTRQIGPTPLQHAGTTTIEAPARYDGGIDNLARLTLDGEMNTAGATVGSITGSGTLLMTAGTFTTGGDNTDSSFTGFQVSGPGNLTKVGTGRQTFRHIVTYLGDTTISGGVLAIGDGVTGPGVLFNVIDNAALELNVPGGISLSGTFTGSGSLTVVGGLASALGVLTHAGTTTINAGATFGASLNNNALLTVNGTFNTGGATAGSLTGNGTLNINSGNAIIGGDNTSTTFGGVIGSVGTFAKVGTGTLTLTGASTLTGFSVVVAGTLLANGTLPGPVVVGAGATLGGTGAVGPVQVNAGGTLSPGLSPGVLNTGNVVLAGVLLQEIEGPALGAQYDNVNTTGTVDVTGATLTLAGVYVPVAGNTFTIISNDGADAIVGTFAGLAEGATVVLNGVNMTISYVGGTGNDVVLTVAPAPAGVGGPPIPTLSQWMLLLLALLMLTIGLRAQRRKSR